MKKLIYLFFAMAILTLTNCQKEEQAYPIKLKAEQIGINNSTIYKVETDALWTTSLNMLTIIVKYNVTPSTQIFLNGAPAKLYQLKPKFRVTVYYDVNTKNTIKILAYSY